MFSDVLVLRGMDARPSSVWFEVACCVGYMSTFNDSLLDKQAKTAEWREHCNQTKHPCVILDSEPEYTVRVFLESGDLSFRVRNAIRCILLETEGAQFLSEDDRYFVVTKIRSPGAAMDAASSLVRILK